MELEKQTKGKEKRKGKAEENPGGRDRGAVKRKEDREECEP
jgi:hypothetical protein